MSEKMTNLESNKVLFDNASDALEKQNYKKAFELFLKAAENGDSFAQNNLGYFWDEGIYVKKNVQKALFWYKKAVKQGDGSAATNIALNYKEQQKYSKALWWFHKAANLLDHDAYYEIAQLYEHGYGVKKNTSNALKFYRKAVSAKHITEDFIEKSKEKIKTLKT